ncbi:MAG: hypothetical protein O9340_15140 [Cyclobacteriaceae bacterium]|jgi:hypothetical protein|nr:hypothetical protein [Cyclobacteriaceae bacterium]
MASATQNLSIFWHPLEGELCLKFVFKHKFLKIDAVQGIVYWKACFNEKQNQKITLIWDCTEMTDYEPFARVAWQQALSELKEQIETIWLISDSKLIRAGASILSFFTSLDIKAVKTENEVKMNLVEI